jgi:phosphoribosylformylglycinamidine (FGAM) synthase-like enzyme
MAPPGGGLGLTADLTAVPLEAVDRTDTILFSESSGRFIITVDPNLKGQFEAAMAGCPCGCIGKVTGEKRLVINGKNGARCIDTDIQILKSAWKKPFGELI